MNREEKCLEIISNMDKIFNNHISYNQMQRKYEEDGNIFFEKEVHLLKQIIENPDNTVTVIAEKTMRTKSSVSQILKRLITKKLIKTEKDPEDKRKVVFIPTEDGKKLYKAHEYYDSKMAFLLSKFLKEYSNEDIELFLEILKKYYEYLTQNYTLKDI